MRHLAALLCAAALAGCAADLEAFGRREADRERRTVASGLIGCAPDEITVSDHRQQTWTAVCRERTFYCLVGPTAACTERLK